MSTPTHTPEPWRLGSYCSIWRTKSLVVCQASNEQDAQRIFECVNAFAGIDNPAQAIHELKELRDWKAQAGTGVRMIEEAHEILKAERDELLNALEGILHGTTVEFAEINGFGEQRMKACQVYDRAKWGVPKSNV